MCNDKTIPFIKTGTGDNLSNEKKKRSEATWTLNTTYIHIHSKKRKSGGIVALALDVFCSLITKSNYNFNSQNAKIKDDFGLVKNGREKSKVVQASAAASRCKKIEHRFMLKRRLISILSPTFFVISFEPIINLHDSHISLFVAIPPQNCCGRAQNSFSSHDGIRSIDNGKTISTTNKKWHKPKEIRGKNVQAHAFTPRW